MATSGTYNFTVTRDDIIRFALLNLGKLGEGEGPTAQESSDIAKFLNMMVKTWMGQADFAPGLKMFSRRQGHLFLSTTQGQYNLGFNNTQNTGVNLANWTNSYIQTALSVNAMSGATSIQVESIAGINNGDNIGIQMNGGYQNGNLFWTTVNGTPSGTTINLSAAIPAEAYSGGVVYDYSVQAQMPIVTEAVVLRDVNREDVPINLWTVQDYMFAPSKADPNYISDPVSVYTERHTWYTTLFTDVAGASDVTKHLVIEYMEPVQDFNNPLDNPEYPQEWYMALTWGLTKQICPMFNGVWTQEMQANYSEAMQVARNLDPNRTAMYFQCNDWNEGWSSSY
jgi:hypothetical protein